MAESAFEALVKQRAKSSLREALEFQLELTSQTDRGAALVGAAYLDDHLSHLLRMKFVDCTATDKLLNGKRPLLGSFFIKTQLAFALGLIGEKMRNDLMVVREVRNSFGHGFDPLEFSDSKIEKRIKNLHHKGDGSSKSDTAREAFNRAVPFMGLVLTVNALIESETPHADILVQADLLKAIQRAKAKSLPQR